MSVVMPAYNNRSTIGAAISGVLTQTYPNVELIVVDDGSTDETASIVAGYSSPVKLLRQENGGSSTARNAAMAHAQGAFIAFCDADDILLPSYLTRNLNAYGSVGGGRRIVMNEAFMLTETGLVHGRRLIRRRFPAENRQRISILEKNFVPILAVFPRRLVDDVGVFREELAFCEDWDLWVRAILAGWRVIYQGEPHALYRVSESAKSTSPLRHDAEDRIMRWVEEHYWAELTDDEREFLSLRLRSAPPRLIDLRAGEALRDRDWATARSTYRDLARLSPGDAKVRLRSKLLGYVPGLDRLWLRRLHRIDQRLGGRIGELGYSSHDDRKSPT